MEMGLSHWDRMGWEIELGIGMENWVGDHPFYNPVHVDADFFLELTMTLTFKNKEIFTDNQ